MYHSTEFSYFDQFADVEIDLTDYLASMSNSASGGFKYTITNLQPVKTNIKNLFSHYELVENYKQDIALLEEYIISDFELVEQVSKNYYGSTDYWWIVLLFNNITNPFTQWPDDQERLNNITEQLYNEEGLYSRTTYYRMLDELNEAKRVILLPQPSTLTDIIWAYREAIIKNS